MASRDRRGRMVEQSQLGQEEKKEKKKKNKKKIVQPVELDCMDWGECGNIAVYVQRFSTGE
jgi:hypothetical protein